MSLNKKIATPLIIVIILAILAGGALAYRYWTAPVSTEESATGWSGTITSIDAGERIIEAQGINQKIKCSVLDETVIKDKEGNPLSFNDLKEEDFVSISGTYKMRGKMTPAEWEVVIVAKEIKVLGECVKEGEEKTSDIWCCPDLMLIDQKYCTKCGDSICKAPENKSNCPSDCAKVGEEVTISVYPDPETVELSKGRITFEGELDPSRSKRIEVIADKDTKLYLKSGPEEEQPLTQQEFYSFLKKAGGPMTFPVGIRGVMKEEKMLEAIEMWQPVQ